MLEKMSETRSTRHALKSKGLAVTGKWAREKTIGKSYDVYEKDRLKNGQIGNTYDIDENTGGYASYPTMFMKNKVVRKDCPLRCTSATRAASGTYASLNFCIARRCRGNGGVIGNPLNLRRSRRGANPVCKSLRVEAGAKWVPACAGTTEVLTDCPNRMTPLPCRGVSLTGGCWGDIVGRASASSCIEERIYGREDPR